MIARVFLFLEDKAPAWLKRLVPQSWRIWLGYQIKVVWRRESGENRPKWVYPLALPAGQTERSLRGILSRSYIKEDGPGQERNWYLEEAFRRFLYTLQIVPDGPGMLLEIGANPYFMTLLLTRFTSYDLTFTNYFGDYFAKQATQTLTGLDGPDIVVEFDNINLEAELLPYETHSFDIVLMCEVLEHFTNDPCRALLEIKRVLKPQGLLVLTTPNAARPENLGRLLSGGNVYDAYSAYGPYGRHNREYTIGELTLLLDHMGFDIEQAFTSDVHPHAADAQLSSATLKSLQRQRPADLGQYIFLKATNSRAANQKKPMWLYRSYPANELA